MRRVPGHAWTIWRGWNEMTGQRLVRAWRRREVEPLANPRPGRQQDILASDLAVAQPTTRRGRCSWEGEIGGRGRASKCHG